MTRMKQEQHTYCSRVTAGQVSDIIWHSWNWTRTVYRSLWNSSTSDKNGVVYVADDGNDCLLSFLIRHMHYSCLICLFPCISNSEINFWYACTVGISILNIAQGQSPLGSMTGNAMVLSNLLIYIPQTQGIPQLTSISATSTMMLT